MRLLIAGWQGQIAQSLIAVAPSRADISAFAIGRPALDICEIKTIERAFNDIKPDIVINTAGYTDVDKAEREPERAMASNCGGARLLAEYAARRGVPILHLSTDYVFGNTSDAPFVETCPTEPATQYGKSKLAGEAAVQAANPKHIIIRTSWVYSARGRNFVTNIVRQAREGALLRVVSDRYGSPTYAPHLVDAILAVAASATTSNGSVPWGIYHAAGSGRASWHDVARHALLSTPDVQHRASEIEPINSASYPTVAPRPAHSELDCSKLQRDFGIRLPDWQSGIAECLQELHSASLAAHETGSLQ